MNDDFETGDEHGLGSRFDRIVVEDAPAHVLEQIVHRFRIRTQDTAEAGLVSRLAARVRAVLAFDDMVAGPALALRGGVAATAGPRHLVFAADAPDGPVEIAVSVYPLADARVTIVGQVLVAGDEPHVVEIVSGSEVLATVACSEHGEFTLEAPAAWDELVLVGPVADIVVTIDGGGSAPA